MLKRLFTILFCLVSVTVWSQDLHTSSKKAAKIYPEAEALLNYRALDQAQEMVDEMLRLDSNFYEAHILQCLIYLDLQENDKALEALLRAEETGYDEDKRLFYNIADLYYVEGKYEEALKYLERYETFDLTKRQEMVVKEMKASIEVRSELMSNPVDFVPVNMGANINTPWLEHTPSFTVDASTMMFIRMQPRNIHYQTDDTGMDEDIYLSSYDAKTDTWKKAVNAGEGVNTPTIKQGAGNITPDGQWLYFTVCSDQRGCDIFRARLLDGGYGQPERLPAPINSREWESQPCLSIDGRTLYFTSHRPGGKGGKDIYASEMKADGSWSTPKNLSINTEEDDQSPYLHVDGKSFFFASNGYPGMGKSDIFTCQLSENGTFSEVKNMGYPINGANDEYSLSISPDGERAYYASEREGGFGRWDLYYFELPKEIKPEPVYYARGEIYDAKTKEPVRARFELVDLETGKRIVESYSNAETGRFLVAIPPHRNYALQAEAEGYLFFSDHYDLSLSDTVSIQIQVPMKKVEVGETFVLRNIFFETNKYNLKPESEFELNKLVDFMNNNPNVSIEIGGHTDNVGSQSYNQTLSENRAKSVYDYLIENGISTERLKYKGYNFSMPIASNDTAEGKAQNRRTEVKIIE